MKPQVQSLLPHCELKWLTSLLKRIKVGYLAALETPLQFAVYFVYMTDLNDITKANINLLSFLWHQLKVNVLAMFRTYYNGWIIKTKTAQRIHYASSIN
jgi:hypothetical protein